MLSDCTSITFDYSVQSLLSDDRLVAIVARDGFDAEDVVGFVEAFGDRISPVQANPETEDSF